MVTIANIASWGLFVCALITSWALARRFKQLRNYTFWVEQSLLAHRPETYIPEWRKRQREKDICTKSGKCRYSVQTVERRKTEPAAQQRNAEFIGAHS